MATKKKIKNAVKSSRIRSRKSIKSEPSGDSSVSHTKEFENYIPDKKREEKSMTSSDQNNYAGTKTSRWTIRFKMMVIISSIIVLALTFIIYLATFFFKSDNEVRIKENNIKLTDVIGQKVSTEISALSQNLKVIATTLRQNPRSRASLQKIIFENDKNIIFLGVFSDSGDSLSSSLKLYNNSFLSENSINGDDLEEVTRSNAGVFRKSFSGSTVIHNVSPGFKIPILGVSVPFTSDEGQKTIIITYIKLDHVLSSFQTSGITESFLVNGEGIVVAHPDTKIVLAATKLLDLPIVKAMNTSPIDNGLNRYKDVDGKWYIGSFKKLGFAGAGVISTVSEDKAFEEVYNIQRRNIYLMLVVLSLAIIIVFFFARSLTGPILNLVGASKQIERGHYLLNLKATTSDEIGVLTNSFISMAHGLQERENMKDAFGKFVNKEIAELAATGKLKVGGERKDCAIFFSDIRGFTAISEKLEPEEVVEFLNQYMTEMVLCVKSTHGIVDKFIGDAIMAVWGALKANENNTENAINSALMMRQALLKFNKGRGSAKKPVIKIGCGINSGYVVAGQIGSEEKLEYTVIGDAVNLASRVEALNKPFGTDILISQNAYDKVKGIFKVEKMHAIRVKGKEEVQTIYAVLGREDDPKCPDSLKEVRRIVGINFKPLEKTTGKKDTDFKEEKYELA